MAITDFVHAIRARNGKESTMFRNNGLTALHAAAGMRYTDDSSTFITVLLRAGAEPSIRARDGRTALEIAQVGAAREGSTRDREDAHRRNLNGIVRLLKTARMPSHGMPLPIDLDHCGCEYDGVTRDYRTETSPSRTDHA